MRALLLGMALLLAPGAGGAYTISTGFTVGCHEGITLRAFDDFLLGFRAATLAVPEGDTWREVADFLESELMDDAGGAVDLSDLSDQDRFILISLLIGVRAPDTDGHSFLNLSNLRELHSDPSPEGQYLHALRGVSDDGTDGDLAALEGTRMRLRGLLDQARRAVQQPAEEQIIQGTFYLDFYGRFEVPVWAPMYYLGQAAHIVQDSFSHMIRDEEMGFRRIVHIMNYVDALNPNFEEHRDGLAHSDSMDDCRGDVSVAGGPVEAAQEATVDLFIASRAYLGELDPLAVDFLLAKWFTLEAGCTVDDGFCGNDFWLGVARQAQTEPYLESLFRCDGGATRRPPPPSRLLWALVLLFIGLRVYDSSRNHSRADVAGGEQIERSGQRQREHG